MRSITYTQIDDSDATLCARIGEAKAHYLAEKTRLNAARGLYGQAMFQWKKAARIICRRPLTQGGDIPPYTDAQLSRAEIKARTAQATMWALDTDSTELRTRLLAYGFLRGRTYGRMESNLNVRTSGPDINLIAKYAHASFEVIQHWIKNPDSKPVSIDRETIEREGKIASAKLQVMEIERKLRDATRHEDHPDAGKGGPSPDRRQGRDHHRGSGRFHRARSFLLGCFSDLRRTRG